MREFEKWDVGNKINYATVSSGELNVQHERCKAWKAALKWAKAMHDVSSEPRFAVNIREELKS